MKNDAGYLAVDPVCGMKVNPAEAARSTEFEGKTYHICSAACQQKFADNPISYVSPALQRQGTPVGHREHGRTVASTRARKDLAKDPVCGMMVDRASSLYIGSSSSSLRGAMWGCAALMAALAAAVPLYFGWAWWSALLALVLLACPVGLVWTALRFGRGANAFSDLPTKERRKP